MQVKMALVKEKEFKRRGGDIIDPFHLKCEITVVKRPEGDNRTHMIRAALNTGQFDKAGKTTEPLSSKHWEFTDSMMNDPKGKMAIQAYKRLMDGARLWLQKELNIYKFPSH